jgi:hypothetical protein
MSRFSACNLPTCATLVEGKASICPKCGGPMRDVGESPVRGILLLLCGLFLVGLMGAIAWKMAPSMLSPGETIEGTRFTGSADQARLFLGLFALVILFGLTATVNGIFMIVTRRQSRVLIAISLGLATVLMIAAFIVRKTMA